MYQGCLHGCLHGFCRSSALLIHPSGWAGALLEDSGNARSNLLGRRWSQWRSISRLRMPLGTCVALSPMKPRPCSTRPLIGVWTSMVRTGALVEAVVAEGMDKVDLPDSIIAHLFSICGGWGGYGYKSHMCRMCSGGSCWVGLHFHAFALACAFTCITDTTTCPQVDLMLAFVLHYIYICIALHCIALRCIVLYCIALHCIALHCIAVRSYFVFCEREAENCTSALTSDTPKANHLPFASLHCIAAHRCSCRLHACGTYSLLGPRPESV